MLFGQKWSCTFSQHKLLLLPLVSLHIHTVEYSISTEKLEDNKVVLAYFIAKCAHMVVEYVPSAWICPCLVKQKAVDFVHTRQFDLNVSLT